MCLTVLQKSIQAEKEEAAIFAPFWNEIINCLREEDYITDRYVVFRQVCMIFRLMKIKCDCPIIFTGIMQSILGLSENLD